MTQETEPAEKQPSKPRVARGADSIVEKMTITLFGFVLTGVIGGMLTTWIQQRGWAWQNRVTAIEKDVANVVSANKAASELINQRWHAAYRMTRAIEREEDAEAWRATRANFDSADRDWALHYSNATRDVEFNVDAPFGVSPVDLNRVWSVDCDKNGAVFPFETQSARVLLEIVNHCHGQLKNIIEPLIAPTPDERRMTKANKDRIDAAYRRLDRLYKMNDALRCVIFDRAMAIRGAQSTQSYWSAFFGVQAPTYRPGRQVSDCV